jgi:hypothetical protein
MVWQRISEKDAEGEALIFYLQHLGCSDEDVWVQWGDGALWCCCDRCEDYRPYTIS